MWNLYFLGIDFFKLFYCFIIYCFVGWIWETCYVSIKDGKLVNRGFLNGPVIPIYGCAATGIFLTFFNPLLVDIATENNVKSYLLIFFIGAFVASLLEYITSFSMEKMFHAKWWDYTDVPFNINGRVCLPASIFWGLLSIVLVKLLHPAVLILIEKFPRKTGETAGYVILAVFMADVFMTLITTIQLDRKLTSITLIRKELNNITDTIRDVEIRLRNEFKDKYKENPVGGTVSKAADRVDATIAFGIEGITEKIYEINAVRKESVDEIDRVLAENKERTEKLLDENKERAKKILDNLKGFQRYTVRRLTKAFPNLKPVGDRGGSLQMVLTYISSKKKKHQDKDKF